jgi:hypothetical protein
LAFEWRRRRSARLTGKSGFEVVRRSVEEVIWCRMRGQRLCSFRRQRLQERFEEPHDPQLDRLGIRASEPVLEFRPAATLFGGHGTLATQGAVGEVIEEPAVGADGKVGMEWEILGVLERFEAIDNERFAQEELFELVALEEEAVASEPCDMPGDSGVGGSEDASDLPESGAFRGHPGDAEQEIRSAEPVGGAKGSGREAAAAACAAIDLEAVAV